MVRNVSFNGSPCAQEERRLANSLARMDSEGILRVFEQADIESLRDVVESRYLVRPGASGKNTSTWPDPSVVVVRINDLLGCTPPDALDVRALDLPDVDSWIYA